MFDLKSFIDVSDGKPGMLVPLFGTKNTNLPYVQQMDEFFQVREVVPFLEYESYPLALAESTRSISIGDNGLIAFRSFDGAIICGDLSEILAYVSQNIDAIAENNLLHSQLQRIEGAELNPSYEVWRKVATIAFPKEHEEQQRKFWVDSELSLFQKQKKIWSEIDPVEPDDPTVGDSAIYSSITERSTEFLIRWLSNRKNFVARDWTKIWHYVNERIPFDERMPEIALRWIFFVGEENFEFHQTKSVLLVLLDRWLNDTPLADLGDFLSSKFATEEALLFDFVRPRKLFFDLMVFMTTEGNPEDLFQIVSFAVAELPKDEGIIEALQIALETLLESPPSEANRLKLFALWDELRKAEKRVLA